MIRRIRTIALFGIALTLMPAGGAGAQQTNEQLAARCAQLGAIFDRYASRRGEGSGGPDMERLGAGIDCSKGRYDKGIKALEDLLRRDRISFPPA
ncbi:MAG: hypothetical protein Q8M19_02435 [Reyranella sp.]|nr:hypothetical protein [Reyranella sp.]